MTACRRLQPHHETGLALVAILWLVAGLSLTALALARTVRTETQMVAQAGQALVAQTWSDAGVHLTMQALKVQPGGISTTQRIMQTFKDRSMLVELAPLTGWIDINRAPEPLLASAIERLGEVEAAHAAELASELVRARQIPKENGTEPKVFASVEDLIRLPRWDIDVWSKVSPFLTANNGAAGGGVNPLAAPLPVLKVLALGNAALAERIHEQAQAGAPAIDTTGLQADWITLQGSRLLQITIHIDAADGSRLKVKRRVDLGGSPGDGLSWRIIHESVGVESVHPEPVQITP